MESNQYNPANSSIQESNVPARESTTDISVWNPQALYEWVIPTRDVFLIHCKLWRRMIVFKMWNLVLYVYVCVRNCVWGCLGGVWVGGNWFLQSLWSAVNDLKASDFLEGKFRSYKLFHIGIHEEPIEFQCLHLQNTTYSDTGTSSKSAALGWRNCFCRE